jgi:hypothetical protein
MKTAQFSPFDTVGPVDIILSTHGYPSYPHSLNQCLFLGVDIKVIYTQSKQRKAEGRVHGPPCYSRAISYESLSPNKN